MCPIILLEVLELMDGSGVASTLDTPEALEAEECPSSAGTGTANCTPIVTN